MSDEEKLEFSYAFTEATKQQLFGNYKQAVSLYLKCIQVNPSSAASFYQLSTIFSSLDDKSQSIGFARKAVDIDPDNFWYLVQLANLYQVANQKDSAIAIYKLIVKNQSSKYEFRYDLALLYMDVDDYKNALDELQKIESEIGVTEQTAIAKHQVYVNMKKYDKAEEEIRKLIVLNSLEVKYHGILAEMFGDINQKEKALESYRRIFEIEPDNTMALFSISEYYMSLKDSAGLSQTMEKIVNSSRVSTEDQVKILGNLLNNTSVFEKFKEPFKNWIEILMQKNPDDLLVKGLVTNYFVKSEDYESARVMLLTLIVNQKNNSLLWQQLLYIENLMQNHESLIVHADSAIKYIPDEPVFYLLKGIALHQSGHYNQAIEILTRGIAYVQEKDQRVQFHTFLAESYYKIQNFVKAEEFFDKVLADDPMNVYVLNNFSYYLAINSQKLDKAAEMAEKAIRIEPESSTYLDTYAWVLYKQKKYSKALEMIEKAFKNGGQDNGEIAEHYGDILYCNGQIEKANEFWLLAIDLGQNKEEIEKKMLGFRCK